MDGPNLSSQESSKFLPVASAQHLAEVSVNMAAQIQSRDGDTQSSKVKNNLPQERELMLPEIKSTQRRTGMPSPVQRRESKTNSLEGSRSDPNLHKTSGSFTKTTKKTAGRRGESGVHVEISRTGSREGSQGAANVAPGPLQVSQSHLNVKRKRSIINLDRKPSHEALSSHQRSPQASVADLAGVTSPANAINFN